MGVTDIKLCIGRRKSYEPFICSRLFACAISQVDRCAASSLLQVQSYGKYMTISGCLVLTVFKARDSVYALPGPSSLPAASENAFTCVNSLQTVFILGSPNGSLV